MQITGLLSHHAIKPYSRLHQITPGPKWYIFEGNLDDNKDLDEYVTALSQFLLDAKEFIHVVGGELCSKVWSHQKVVKALETSKAKDISFVCGPIFDKENTKLIELLKENRISLWSSPVRQKEHFRGTDNGIFIEGCHESNEPERSAIFCKNAKIISSTYYNKFKQLEIGGNIEKVKVNEILSKFKVRAFDPTIKDKYRLLSEDEERKIQQILV